MEENQIIRVEFTRNGKSLSTSLKPVDEETGIVEIKQSFNQKIKESYDNQQEKWVPDLVELSLMSDDDLIGVCRFDITRYIDLGARTEKISMIGPEQEAQSPDYLVMNGDSANHEDAFIIFRIFADTIAEEQKTTKQAKRANNANEKLKQEIASTA